MKKVTMIFAVVAVMFAAVACGTKSTPEEVVVTDSVEVVEVDTTATEVVTTDSLAVVEAAQ